MKSATSGANARFQRLWALPLAALTLSAALPAFAQDARLHLSGLDERGGNDRFIVRYRDGSAPRGDATALRSRLGAAASGAGRGTQLQALRRMANGADVVRASRKLHRVEAESLMRGLAANPDVEYVEVDARLHAAMTPNDPGYPQQWGYSAPFGIKANQAWDRATGAGVVVAVVDSGVTQHSDLAANLLPGYDFISEPYMSRDGDGRDGNPRDEGDWDDGTCESEQVSQWHGMHVAGTIAAVTNNGKGVASVAPAAKILPVRVLGYCGGYMSDVADGIIWASGGSVPGAPANANQAEVINVSLGAPMACAATLQNAINTSVSRGATVVVAAGNNYADASVSMPANCQNVIAVGATTSSGARADFSNYGSLVDIAAPGFSILSVVDTGATTPVGEGYSRKDGTSMAAPHVAGVVALMQSATATPKTPAQIKALLKATAMPFPATPSQPIGAGIVDANAAVAAVLPPLPVALVNGVAVAGLSGAKQSERLFSLTVPAGATGLKFTTSGGAGDADLYVKFGGAPTTSSYSCRSFRTGNAETCSITTAQAGTYYVLVRGYSAYTGLSITGSFTAATSARQAYANTTVFPIADLRTVESPIAISGRGGNAPANASVSIDIAHTYRGDLKVDLIAPDGTLFNLHNRTGGSADDLVKTTELDLSGEPLNGIWKLRVYDGARGDTGRLRQWSITF